MGMKKTSEIIAISYSVIETAPNTYTEQEIALQLDVLNNEVFVVLAVDIQASPPDAIAATNTNVQASLTSTTQTTITFLDNTNTIAASERAIRAAGFLDAGVAFEHSSTETPNTNLDYVGIIATNNFFVSVRGTANAGVKSNAGRVWGYRAKADSSTYAALVQSEILSA